MNNGDIWLLNLDPTVGAEIHKTRPAIIVNCDTIGILPLKIIVPVTDWKSQYSQVPWMVKLIPNNENHLDKPSVADTFQVRSVSQKRFVRHLGKVDIITMEKIKDALKRVFDIDS